jgi:ABC-type polysaccharide/polyol phosphate export permease
MTRDVAPAELSIEPTPAGQVRAAFADVVRSAWMWHIWVRLGVQDVRLKFRRSAVGPAWIFLNLSVMIGAIGFIYGHLLGQDLHEFIPYLTAGLVTWGYLTSSMVEGAQAFVNSEGYIKQISLPIYVYVFRCFVNAALTGAISLSVFAIVAVGYRVPIGVGTLWAIPGMLLLMAVSLLLICILAHLNARFRDVAPTVTVGMQMLFYVTPVIFPAELLRRRGMWAVIDLNPFYHLLEIVRRPLLTGHPAAAPSYIAVFIMILVLTAIAAGMIAVFRRRIVFAL